MDAGSWEAIRYELQHGNAWKVIDELLHALEGYYWRGEYHYWPWINDGPIAELLYRYCCWAHRDDAPGA